MSNKNTSIFSYLVLSDIHLGHHVNKTDFIIRNLQNYFRHNHKLFKTLSVIFIAGDIFEKLLTTNSKEYVMIMEWLTELVIYCSSNNIKLRILEGTPSHDWKQANAFIKILEKLNLNIDFKYIDTLHIEKMADYNMNILYIPDEYKHNASDTFKDVLKLLKENNLSQADIAIMHGQFNYQLPMIKLPSSHNEEDYLSIIKHYISIGHIHTPSVFDRILAQGSFDRLAHNEEEDKGGMYIKIINGNTKEYLFIKNTDARLYKTLRTDSKDVDEIISELDKFISKLPEHSSVRCIVRNDINISKSIKTVKERYPLIRLTIESAKRAEVNNNTLIVNDTSTTVGFSITKNNIEELLFKEVNNHNLTPNELSVCRSEFQNIYMSL